MALRDPRNKSRNNASKRTTSATRSKRAASSAKYNPKPSSAAQRSGKKGSGSSKVTTGKGGKISSPRLRQALEGVKTKRTPAKTPPKVKTKPASSTPRGAQGPRTAPQQGPSQRVSGLQGSRTTPKPTNTPPKAATPKASRVGPQIKQAKAVQAANPGRAARAARNVGTAARLARAASNPYTAAATIIGSDIMNRSVADGTLKGKPNVPTRSSSANKYNTRDADGTVRSRLKVGPKKVGAKKVGTAEQAFDNAYAAAKKAGKKTFTFDGKKYSTK